MRPPATQYARTADGAHIAYQVFGAGEHRIVAVGEWLSNVEVVWEQDPEQRFFRWLGSFARVLIFDKRGVGLSDHVPVDQPPQLEHWTEDIRTVADAAGWDQASLLAAGAGTALAVIFAATYPARTTNLVVINGYARFREASDYPWGAPERALGALRALFLEHWGTGVLQQAANPGAFDEEVHAQHARAERLSASPGTAASLVPLQYQSDVRAILPLVRCPALVVHRADDRYVRVGHGRYLAEHLPDARYVELPGDQHSFVVDFEDFAAEVEEFVTGERHHSQGERVLATMMFVDIVGSTSRTAEVGDDRWAQVLEGFDGLVLRQLHRFRGRVVNTRGDDYLAMFDGPARAIACAEAIRHGVGRLGIEVRIGLHAGEVVPHGDDVTGLAVDIAARVCAFAGASEIVVTRTIRDLVVGSGIAFGDAGDHELKGVPDRWQLFRVAPSNARW